MTDEEKYGKDVVNIMAVVLLLVMAAVFYYGFCEAWEYDGWAHSKDAFAGTEYVEE